MSQSSSPQKSRSLIEVKKQELKQLQNELSRLQLSYDELTTHLRKSQRAEGEGGSPEHHPAKRNPAKTRKQETKKRDQFGSKVSQEALGRLKLIFQHYSAISSYLKVDTLELSNFMRLVEESGLLKPKNWRAKANLIFCQGNKSKTIDFWRFVEIVQEVAAERYPEDDKFASLERFVYNDIKAPANDLEERSGLWKNELSDVQVQGLFRGKRQLMTNIYNLFKTQKHPHTDRMVLQGFLAFSQEFGFVPDHLSKPEAAKLFRAVDTGELFTTSISFEEFELACGFMALYIYDRPEHAANCSSPYDCVEAWFQWLDLGVTVLTNGSAQLKTRTSLEFEG